MLDLQINTNIVEDGPQTRFGNHGNWCQSWNFQLLRINQNSCTV